jgi:long-chain-fatty-acid--[acyl-carrier-protein] ligase
MRLIKFCCAHVAYFIIQCALRLRYRVHFKGLDLLTPENLNKPGGILFLPNHPAQLDSIMAFRGIKKFLPRPAAIDYLYDIPGVKILLSLVDAIPVPNLDFYGNSYKTVRVAKALDIIAEGLVQKENFLFYPSGRLKLTGLEIVGGASGLNSLLNKAPDTNIVLIRISGLWGSSFSRAQTGKVPGIGKMLLRGFKHIIKNGIFFSPRRNVTVEVVANPDGFPWSGNRLKMNRFLESYYNTMDNSSMDHGEGLSLVPYSIWNKELPQIQEPSLLGKHKDVNLASVPEKIQRHILDELGRLAQKDPTEILSDHNLAMDLGLDSLDATELLIFLESEYNVSGLHPSDMTTVATLMGLASGQIKLEREEEEATTKETKAEVLWREDIQRPELSVLEGETLHESFLKQCKRMKKHYACADATTGALTYDKLLIRVVLVAEKVRSLKGTRVGIMLPSSVGCDILMLACLLAGKVPVMINWTLGSRYIKHMLEMSEVHHVLTSARFLDRLKNIDLGDIDKYILTFERIREGISLFDKIKAAILSKRSASKILSHFSEGAVRKSHDPALLLFTSGTESLPKGVPLSHNNILSNFRSVREFPLTHEDCCFSFLPPFHSFGCCVTSLYPLLVGLKVVHSPDPTDSTTLAREIERWGITFICSAPSFHKTLLQAATPKQLETARLFVTGAEKAPKDLFKKVASLGGDKHLIEAYGITECAPALTMNLPNEKNKGVGRPLKGVEIIIVHPDTQKPLPQGSDGLILAHGDNIFSGYLGYQTKSPFVTVEGKMWYNTGDIGNLDEDGFLTISGRLKRFVKIGGEMISLGAIEEALLEVATQQGWPQPEEGPPFAICAREVEGERPQLILLSRIPLRLEIVNASLRAIGFSNISKITHIIEVDDIPMTGTGKVQHRKLQEMVNNKEFSCN